MTGRQDEPLCAFEEGKDLMEEKRRAASYIEEEVQRVLRSRGRKNDTVRMEELIDFS